MHLRVATRIAFGNRCITLVCVCLVLGQACASRSGPSSELTVAHEVSPQPPRAGQVTITLRLTDAYGKPVAGAGATLEGNMSHAGMVPVFAETTEIEPGVYRARMELSMAGDWVMLVHLTLRDNRKLERQFEIKGVAPA
jgi:YtkA-like protein